MWYLPIPCPKPLLYFIFQFSIVFVVSGCCSVLFFLVQHAFSASCSACIEKWTFVSEFVHGSVCTTSATFIKPNLLAFQPRCSSSGHPQNFHSRSSLSGPNRHRLLHVAKLVDEPGCIPSSRMANAEVLFHEISQQFAEADIIPMNAKLHSVNIIPNGGCLITAQRTIFFRGDSSSRRFFAYGSLHENAPVLESASQNVFSRRVRGSASLRPPFPLCAPFAG
jgi:hypothetical protein